MSKPLTWPQWLNVIARNITIERPYICCHIGGNYVDDLENPSKTYLEAINSPEYKEFRDKLENEINKELDALNEAYPYEHLSTLSLKLGFPREDGVQGRQSWLRSLKD